MVVWEQCKFRGYWNILKLNSASAEFESSVNSEGIETNIIHPRRIALFESSVNSEGIETLSDTLL